MSEFSIRVDVLKRFKRVEWSDLKGGDVIWISIYECSTDVYGPYRVVDPATKKLEHKDGHMREWKDVFPLIDVTPVPFV